MDISIEKIIEQSGAPISLPEVFMRINELVDDPNCTLADLVRVVERDAGLTARLLKLINSPYYGFPSTVDSISRAIAIIGTRDLRDLALATTTITVFRDMPSKMQNIRHFWRHSLYCAVIAKLLAEARREKYTERFFVAGLLHDIGKLVLYQGLPEDMNLTIEQARNRGDAVFQVEQELLGFTHTEVGAFLARQWNLPDNLIESIAHHHVPERASNYRIEVSMVHLADFLANTIAQEEDLHPYNTPLDPNTWEITGLDRDQLTHPLREVSRQFREVAGLLLPKELAVA